MDLTHVLTDEMTPETVLRAQLGAGESLLWMGRPSAGLRRGDYGQLALGLACLALAAPLLWLLLMPDETGSRNSVSLFALFALLPLIRSVIEVLRRSRTVYAVTDRRILIASGRRTTAVRSHLLRDLSRVALSEELPDGRGTIQLGSQLLFDLIEQAREVAETIRRAQMAVRFPASYGAAGASPS
jgi:hypothetical protein